MSAAAAKVHPVDGLHVSVVHGFLSSQEIGSGPTQPDTVQLSPDVQALPSSQAKPVAGP